MGYRSEVAISLYKRDFEILMYKIKNKIDGFEELKDLMNYADSTKETLDNIIVIKWNWVKWYNEYTDIQKLEEYLNQEDEEGNILVPYCFTRIGEEREDIEVIHHIDDDDWDLDCIEPITYIDSPDGNEFDLDLD